ncbi:MAG: MarR family winged helix-turn-helix transcriptional regulator [Hyphomicrobiaceae bacterium]
MADINSDVADNLRFGGKPGGRRIAKSSPPDEALVAIVELLFFAYRDFTHEPDEILAQFGFGRAHHRVLHFVNRRPGMRVADLLDILHITKQSLARVLKELVDRGFIQQEAGPRDRRERRLHLTAKGRRLAGELVKLQKARIKQALTNPETNPDASEVVRHFLLGMIGAEHRAEVFSVVGGGDIGAAGASEGNR